MPTLGSMLSLFYRWRRSRFLRRPFPESWHGIVDAQVPFAGRMSKAERTRFLDDLKVFAFEKRWEGAHGLEVTDEMKVVISAAAARLTQGLSLAVYDRLKTIIIYPSHYQHEDKDGVIFGEASLWGTVVLSWDAVRHGIGNPFDGHDTALHEFAHIIDAADGTFDGTPILDEAEDYRRWAKIFSSHYLKMKKRPHRSALRRYGATNEAEFFAVATETFFEKPRSLKKRAPELYHELMEYYQLDPARRKD